MSDFFEKAAKWIENDIDQKDIDLLSSILSKAKKGSKKDLDILEQCFSGSLEFGTAGLRGKMFPGESNMNRANVRRTAYGLGQFILNQYQRWVDSKSQNNVNENYVWIPQVVIGYDARYNSYHYALDSAKILGALGCRVRLMPKLVPTPCLAFVLKNYSYDCGIMVTASHNPKDDNGYKVYLGGKIVEGIGQGAQIVPPFDNLIQEEIKKAPAAKDIKMDGEYGICSQGQIDQYIFSNTNNSLVNPLKMISKQLKNDKLTLHKKVLESGSHDEIHKFDDRYHFAVTLTAMHGVGYPFQEQMLKDCDIWPIYSVKEQQLPDPDFPTVPFPNPEEKGAFDLALKQAIKGRDDLILANDPDADRMSACAYDYKIDNFRQLTGDEIGIILGNYFASYESEKKENKVIASSIVSSRLLEKICKDKNVKYVRTLTGFKWITRAAKPNDLLFGYEEAIGYCCNPSEVLDKDGPSAGLYLALIAKKLKSEGVWLIEHLDNIYNQYGHYFTAQVSLRFDSPLEISKLVTSLINNPPKEIHNEKVSRVINLNEENETGLITNGIMIFTDKDTRIICRPSGTEPKVKFYIETINQGMEKLEEICEWIRKEYA